MYAMWSWCIWSLCLFVVLLPSPTDAVVGGAPAAPPEPDAAVVFAQKHGRSARIEGIKDEKLGYYSFFGIRYAEPPVGPRRFQRPIRRILSGEQNATRPCFMCPQPHPTNPDAIVGQEDCLCLNVFAPKMPGDEAGCPVIFFIHGGNYRSGSATLYGGKHMTQTDTILVVAQYRLGSLGFLSNGQKDASGNAGLFDIHVAMAWVQDYIEFFGGDPSRITIMGQGSGGSAASLMALSSEGRSSSGVVALSGSPLSPGAVRSKPEKHASEIAKLTGCPEKPAVQLILCLRKQPVEKIIKADNQMLVDLVDAKKFLDEISGRAGTGARVEGEYDWRGLPTLVAEAPVDSLKKKRQRFPLLTGVTSAETVRAVFGKFSSMLTTNLEKISNFIKKDVIGGLNDVVSRVEGLIPINTPELPEIVNFEKYYDRWSQGTINIIDGLSSIAEATGDALFNLPALKSVQQWRNGASAFLYSFEFAGNLTKGSHFLPGVALADDSDSANSVYQPNNKGPSHGDELAYLFEPLDNDGKSIEVEASQTDSRVRNLFVCLVSNFAHVSGLETKNVTKTSCRLPKMSLKDDSFLKITDDIKIDERFRFCQMGMWGKMAERITESICQNQLQQILKFTQSVTHLNPILPATGLSDKANDLISLGQPKKLLKPIDFKQKPAIANLFPFAN